MPSQAPSLPEPAELDRPARPPSPPRRRSTPIRGVLRAAVRLLGAAALLVVISFALVQAIPGDPARRLLGPQADEATVARVRAQLGLDQPLSDQFLHYVQGVATGDLGTSFRFGAPVTSVIADLLPSSLTLALLALVVIYVVALPVGIAAAASRGRWRTSVDRCFSVGTGLFSAVPEYVMATVLTVVLAIWLRLLPAAGSNGPTGYVLPVLAIGLPAAAYLARLVRAAALDVLTSDYVRTARAKQLPAARIFVRHVLPTVATSSLALGSVLLANLIGGAIIVESVFARPGIGSALVQAVSGQDYPLIQGIVLVVGLFIVAANMVVDRLLIVLDPRRG